MPIRIQSSGDSDKKLGEFPAWLDKHLFELASDDVDYGTRRMAELVPHGASGRLQSAVMGDKPDLVGASHVRGKVFVNPFIFAEAAYVDQGTGVDGPHHIPVFIVRPSRTDPSKTGVMVFKKLGEGTRFRMIVKFRHSSKIEAGKNFTGRTHQSMTSWTRLHVNLLHGKMAAYFKYPR